MLFKILEYWSRCVKPLNEIVKFFLKVLSSETKIGIKKASFSDALVSPQELHLVFDTIPVLRKNAHP